MYGAHGRGPFKSCISEPQASVIVWANQTRGTWKYMLRHVRLTAGVVIRIRM